MSIVLSKFARKRLFPTNRLDKIQGVSPDQFEHYINQNPPQQILDGYASFCKLLVYPNWTDTRVMAVEITNENRHLLRSRYEARSKKELPVLARWFEGIEPPKAGYLLVIVYNQEQMHKEGDTIDADWGVVGVLPTADAKETPLTPITIMRNSLGVEEGGSGVPIDREAYLDAADFWDKHATWRTLSEGSE